jgi:hypothetical protein
MELTHARGHHALAGLKPAGNHHAFGHLPHADLAVFKMERVAFPATTQTCGSLRGLLSGLKTASTGTTSA